MEKKQSIFSKIAYSCFYLGVILEVLMVLVDKSAYINPVEGRLFQITFLLFLIKVCLEKYTFREYAVIFLFCVIGAVSYFVTGRNEVIRLVMFIAACKNVDMRQCLKMVFYITLAGCSLIILLSVTNIYGAVSLTQDYGRGSVETRYTLGMGHPNALHCMVWALTALYLYLYAEKMKIYHYMIILIINMGFFLLTDSKTSMLVVIFTIMLAYMAARKNFNLLAKLSAVSGIGITILCVGISILIAGNAYRVYNYVWYDERTPATMFLVKLNNLLNGRIRILVENETFEGTIQTWRLFSRPENNRYFDMGWIRLFYWYGIIPACLFLGAMLLMLFYLYKKKYYLAIMLTASFALYTVIEAHGISVYLARNYVFFLIGECWWQMIPQGNEKRGKFT